MSTFAIDLVENYAALWIAIQYGLENAEAAFKVLDKALADPFFKRVNKERIFDKTITVSTKRDDLEDEDIEHMISLREKKVTYKDIGVMYGMTDQAIYQRIRVYKFGRKPSVARKKEDVTKGICVEDYAHLVDEWKDELEIIRLKQSGKTYREIGEMFGLSYKCVFNKMRRFINKHIRVT